MIIGISGMMFDKNTGAPLGPAGAGKDTVADMLCAKHNFVKVALADEIKRTAMRWYGFTEEQLWGPSELRATPSPLYPNLICRDVLQKLGTEVGREIYLDTWVDITISIAKRLAAGNCYYDRVTGVRFFPTTDMMRGRSDVVIPDVRWAAGNEGKAILAAGGYLWRVTRHGVGLPRASAAHASERAACEESAEQFHAVIENEGTFDDLEKRVDLTYACLQGRRHGRAFYEELQNLAVQETLAPDQDS